MSDDITIKDGYMYGGWRRATNAAIDVKGSIHDDVTAQKLGMRGGAVTGTIHLNLFPPLLLKAFGERWFEQGTLSIYYTYALTDGEQVRAVIGIPSEGARDAQVEAWIESPDGHTVGRGTASIGEPAEASYLRSLELKSADPDELRILAGLKAGDELPSRDATAAREGVDRTLATITEPLEWYRGDSPWGGAIVPPSNMYAVMAVNPERISQAVGFFGATELRNINGPIKVGVPYRTSGHLVCVGASAKTEYYWFDSQVHEKESGKLVAEMRHMTRLMKASSPLYQEGQPAAS